MFVVLCEGTDDVIQLPAFPAKTDRMPEEKFWFWFWFWLTGR